MRMEEDAPEASVVDVARPSAATTSQAETAQLEPLSVHVAASAAGRTKEGAPETTLADLAMGQASASMSPAPSIAERAAPEELLSQEGSASLGIDAEPCRSLVRVGSDPHAWEGS